MSRRTHIVSAVVLASFTFGGAAPAAAHGIGGRTDLPLPAWQLAWAAGFAVAVCGDQAGRIIDRLVRPKYNDALRFLDEGLATAKDMDLTSRMGLGYPDGLIERTERGGLARHHDITKALHEVYGTQAFVPARRAIVAKAREIHSAKTRDNTT